MTAMRGKIAPDLASPEERGFLLAISELKSTPKSSRGEIAGRHTEAPPNRAQRC
jgi:hypothetical protein